MDHRWSNWITLKVTNLERSSRSHSNWTVFDAGGSELRADFQMAVGMSARLKSSSHASLEGGNDL